MKLKLLQQMDWWIVLCFMLWQLPICTFCLDCYCGFSSKHYSSLKCSLNESQTFGSHKVHCESLSSPLNQAFVLIGSNERIQGIAPWGLSSLNYADSLQINVNMARLGVQALAGLKNLSTLNLMHSTDYMESCSLAHLCSLEKVNLKCSEKFPEFLTLMQKFSSFRLTNCYSTGLQAYCVRCKQNPYMHVIRFRPGPKLGKYSIRISSKDCFEQACSTDEMCNGNSQLQAVLNYKDCVPMPTSIVNPTTTTAIQSESEITNSPSPISTQTSTIEKDLKNPSESVFNKSLTSSTNSPAVTQSQHRTKNYSKENPKYILVNDSDNLFLNSTPKNSQIISSSSADTKSNFTSGYATSPLPEIMSEFKKTTIPPKIEARTVTELNPNSAVFYPPPSNKDDILASKITLAIACCLAFSVGIIVGSLVTFLFVLKFKSMIKTKASLHNNDAITREELQPL